MPNSPATRRGPSPDTRLPPPRARPRHPCKPYLAKRHRTRYREANHSKEGIMGEVVHTSRIKIVRETGPTRRAVIEGFSEPVYYGVHGGIKRFYRVDPEKEHAATLDHIVAATAG